MLLYSYLQAACCCGADLLEFFSMMTKLSQAWPDLVQDDIIQQRVHVVT